MKEKIPKWLRSQVLSCLIRAVCLGSKHEYMFVTQPPMYWCYALDICDAKSYVLLLSISDCRDLCLITITNSTSCCILFSCKSQARHQQYNHVLMSRKGPIIFGAFSIRYKSCISLWIVEIKRIWIELNWIESNLLSNVFRLELATLIAKCQIL